ncbi:MAG: hypothetical protein AAF791_03190 [Bacteroidota bacterium]
MPREFLGDAREVEVRVMDSGEVHLVPVSSDPLDGLADAPIDTGLGDAAEHHDRYLQHP